MNTPEILQLDSMIALKWQSILEQPLARQFVQSIMGKDRRVYALYLTQVYHYAFHTARNQALVAVNQHNRDIHYMQFCLEHALEETGHELMALHDLRSMGVPIEEPDLQMPPALPPTQLLIAYLYWISQHGNPVHRLGYSFWAERSYSYIQSFMDNMLADMELSKSQMTFFYSHSSIDDKHAKDVEEILVKICKTNADWEAVTETAKITLDLTEQIIYAVIGEYEKLIREENTPFGIVNCLRAGEIIE